MATNLDLQTQLNQLIADQNKLLEQSTKLFKDQSSFMHEMVDSFKSANFKEVASDIQNATQAVGAASDASKSLGTTNQDVFEKLNNALKEAVKKEDETAKGLDQIANKGKNLSVALAALDGFVQGLRMTVNVLRSASEAGLGFVESLSNIAASIIAIPFKMLSGLINMAGSGSGDTALRQALEDIRKEFGALHATSGRAIISMARSMKGQLAETGLSVYRVFGNLAEKLKTMQEYAHNLGPLFAALSMQFVRNAEAIGAYYKGLGLTEEGQKAVAARAFALQTALTDELREIANYSLQLSKAFNGAAGSAKEISRDMATLMADFKHFGGISTKEIGQAVVYFRRLGIEISKVMGVIDKYDNFEDAANGAAQLSQAFNLNVDALEMMKAQNPAERVEMLRKAFFAAGRTVENMTRQERALLSQQSGLEDSALDLAFSLKNQGMSYDDVTKKADAAKKTQMTQTQAMKALADAIERLVKSGSSGSGGFIDRFIQGFTVGIQRSREFRHLMRELRADLRVAYWEGIKVGKAFVAMFPGVREAFQGLSDLFERRRFRQIFTGARETFKEFFRDLTSNPETALPKLLEHLKDNFFSWFQSNSPNGQRIVNGFKTFFFTLSKITGSMLKIALTKLTEGVRYITDLLAGRAHLDTSILNAETSFIGKILGPIIGTISAYGPQLWNAIKEMFTQVWVKIGPWVKSHLLDVVGILLAPSAIGFGSRMIAVSFANMFTQGLLEFVKSGGISRAFASIKDRFLTQIGTATQAMNRAPVTGSGQQGAGQAIANTVQGAEQAAQAAVGSKVNWGAALVKMVAITAFIVGGMVGILYAIYRFAKAIQENHITRDSIINASLAMVTTATSMVAVAGSIKLLSAINLNMASAGRIIVGLGIVGLVGAGMALGAKKLIENFSGFPREKIATTIAIMAATGTFFLAAAGITAIAAGLGAIALGGSGVGALAIIAGLEAIALTTEGMTLQGIRIMEAINRFHAGRDFVEKANVFVNIMKGVASFATAITGVIAQSRPGFLELVHGSSEQRNTLLAVNNTLAAIGSQLVLIVNTIKNSITSLSGSETELRSAQSLASVLSSVADLGNALKPPAEAMQESGWYTTLTGGGEDIANKIQATISFVHAIGPELRLFMRTIAGMFTGDGAFARGITPEQERATQVIPTILKGVGDFIGSLRSGTSRILELASEGRQEAALIAVGIYMSSFLSAITSSNLFQKINDTISAITNSVATLNPGQIQAIQALAPIIGPAFNVIAQIGSVIAAMATSSTRAPAQLNTDAIYQLNTLVNSFFERMKTDMPTMINNMRAVFANMTLTEANTFAKGMEGVTRVFQIIGTFPTMLKSVADSGGTIGVDTALNSVNGMISALILKLNPADPTSITSYVRQLNPMVTTLTEEIERGHLNKTAQVVTGMVHKMNELATTINGLEPINIETGLRRLGDSLGLGATGEYRIEHRNFNINVNLVVKFDNDGLDAFELGMLRRNGPTPTRIQYTDISR